MPFHRPLNEVYAETLSSSATSYTVTHNRGTRDVLVSGRVLTTAGGWMAGEGFTPSWDVVDDNSITVKFATAPDANQMRIIVRP